MEQERNILQERKEEFRQAVRKFMTLGTAFDVLEILNDEFQELTFDVNITR